MLGCTYGTMFQTTIAGGSYQEGLTVHLQGVPVGLHITEAEIYEALLTRKPEDKRSMDIASEPCDCDRLRWAFSELMLVLMV